MGFRPKPVSSPQILEESLYPSKLYKMPFCLSLRKVKGQQSKNQNDNSKRFSWNVYSDCKFSLWYFFTFIFRTSFDYNFIKFVCCKVASREDELIKISSQHGIFSKSRPDCYTVASLVMQCNATDQFSAAHTNKVHTPQSCIVYETSRRMLKTGKLNETYICKISRSSTFLRCLLTHLDSHLLSMRVIPARRMESHLKDFGSSQIGLNNNN